MNRKTIVAAIAASASLSLAACGSEPQAEAPKEDPYAAFFAEVQKIEPWKDRTPAWSREFAEGICRMQRADPEATPRAVANDIAAGNSPKGFSGPTEYGDMMEGLVAKAFRGVCPTINPAAG